MDGSSANKEQSLSAVKHDYANVFYFIDLLFDCIKKLGWKVRDFEGIVPDVPPTCPIVFC